MILRLQRGTARFDLSAAPFLFGDDFAPPSTAYSTTYAEGTTLNASGGAVVARQAISRDWTFTLIVTGTSQAAIEASIRRLENFLSLSASSADATYLEYSPLDLPEPCYGWFGSVRRYRILSAGAPVIGPLYGNAIARSQAMEVSITLTIDAYATGPARRVGEATGTITEATGTDGLSTGVTIAASSRLRIPVAIGQAEQASLVIGGGAALVVWKTATASTAAGNKFLFSCGNSSLRAYFNGTDDKFYLTDNTNSASSAAQTFASGDTIRLLFTWGATNKLKVYKDGVQIATNSTYTAPSAPTYLFMGTDASSANPALGTLTLTVWPAEPTAAQVAAIDAAAAAVLAAGGRVDHTPWVSSPAGDMILDPYLDTDETNYVTIAGIPGSGAAIYRAELRAIQAAAGATAFIGTCHDPYPDGLTDPATWYYEVSGTAETGNSAGNYGAYVDVGIDPGKRIDVSSCAAVLRARASSGTNTIRLRMSVTKNEMNYLGVSRIMTIGTGYDFLLVPQIHIPPKRSFVNYGLSFDSIGVASVSGSLDRVDYILFLPSLEIMRCQYKAAPSNGNFSYLAFDESGIATANAATGQPPRLLPGHYNTLLYTGGAAGTLTIAAISPRWGLL